MRADAHGEMGAKSIVLVLVLEISNRQGLCPKHNPGLSSSGASV